MSILKNALTRFRCFIGRHDAYTHSTWFFRTQTVRVRTCKNCQKTFAVVSPPRKE